MRKRIKKRIIQQRKRIFIAGEGEGEQSLVKWFQQLANESELHVHLDCVTLEGGGYRTMLKRALCALEHKDRYKIKSRVLLVDGDRAIRDDGWSLSVLNRHAAKNAISICVQEPNLEGLLLRLLPGNEKLQPNSFTVLKQLTKAWPQYKKPADARMLAEKFSLEDLFRVAKIDLELSKLLGIIGLKK